MGWTCSERSCSHSNAATAQHCQLCGSKRPNQVKDPTDWEEKLKYFMFMLTTSQFRVVFLVPWLMFAATLLLFTYFYIKIPFVCWIWSLLVIVVSAIAILYHFFARAGELTMPLATGIMVGVMIATLLGLYIYDTAAIFPAFYGNARKYTNVVASEPSAAVADAGKLTFNSQTRVDIKKSVGYVAENGMVFCVAPVLSNSNQPRIEYWAAGIDCCAASGDFWCDQAQNPQAHGGVVIFDNNGWFTPARYPFYQKARAKAEAQFMLQSVGNPLFVRWVETDNLDMLKNYYSSRAIINVSCWLFIFAILSALMSAALWNPRSMV